MLKIKKQFKFKSNAQIYLLLLLLAVIIAGTNPFTSTLAPMDIINNYPGWQNVNACKNIHHHPERSDILDSKLPAWVAAKRALYKGEVPLWLPSQAGGIPGIVFTTSLMTPAFLLFALVPDDALGFYLSNLINIFIALIGMYLFLRIFYSTFPAVFGAFVFTTSGFMTAWFFWPHINTAIWAPWVLWSIMLCLKRKKLIYAAHAALCMTFLNLGGFPTVAVMTYMAAAIMVLLFLKKNGYKNIQTLKTISFLAVAALFSVIISLPYVIPLLHLFKWMGGIGYRHGGTALKLNDLYLLINPFLRGIPRVEFTMYAGIFPVISILFMFLLFFRYKSSFIYKYTLILFIFSLTIAFALIHPDIIKLIPTLKNNPWSRFIFLIDLALALAAACGINYLLQKSHKNKLYLLLIAFICCSQFVEEMYIFRKFNGSVPRASFYPVTKSISYMKKHITPMQYVISDRSFLISGTLCAYELGDWYAHSFHSKQEKHILSSLVKKAFVTPTAAMFSAEQINTKSPYIDLLNIKYIITAENTFQTLTIWDNSRSQIPSPPFTAHKIIQQFVITKRLTISAINLLLATYGHEHPDTDVLLTLFYEKKLVAVSQTVAKKISDNKWVSFKFPKSLNLKPGKYSISLLPVNQNTKTPITVWANKNEQVNRMTVNGKFIPLSLKMSFTLSKFSNTKYKILKKEPGITILENNNVAGSAYFLSNLDIRTSKPHYSNIQLESFSNNKIVLKYNALKPGWIILPIRDFPGWQFSVNNKPVMKKLFLGMLPAIKVDGSSTIIARYHSKSMTLLFIISIIGSCVILYTECRAIFQNKKTTGTKK